MNLIRRNGTSAIETVIILGMIVAGFCWIVASVQPIASTALSKLASDSEHTQQADFGPASSMESNSMKNVAAIIMTLTAIGAFIVLLPRLLRKKRASENDPGLDDEFENEVQVRKFYETDALFEKREILFKRLVQRCSNDADATVEDIMTSEVITIGITADSNLALRTMKANRIRHIMVCDDEKRLVGVLSNRDIDVDNVKPVVDLMSSTPVIVRKETEISEAVSLMLRHRISCLPVTENDLLVGVVALSDVAISLQCMLVMFKDIFKVIRERRTEIKRPEQDS